MTQPETTPTVLPFKVNPRKTAFLVTLAKSKQCNGPVLSTIEDVDGFLRLTEEHNFPFMSAFQIDLP